MSAGCVTEVSRQAVMRVEPGINSMLDAYARQLQFERTGSPLAAGSTAFAGNLEQALVDSRSAVSSVVELSPAALALQRSANGTTALSDQGPKDVLDVLIESLSEYYELKKAKIDIKLDVQTLLNQEIAVLRAAERRLAASGILAAASNS